MRHRRDDAGVVHFCNEPRGGRDVEPGLATATLDGAGLGALRRPKKPLAS